jgi:kinesin family protein 6/9
VESKAINQSLHYLEQVIVALHDKAKGLRTHIPYRNSLLTSILKDALGGNSNTVMLATISLDNIHLMESVSTCRFAQRVALVKNVVTVNEELDPHLLVQKLKLEVAMLKEELALLKTDKDDIVTSEEADIIKAKILLYLENDTNTLVCGSAAKIRTAFKIFRDLLFDRNQSSSYSQQQPPQQHPQQQPPQQQQKSEQQKTAPVVVEETEQPSTAGSVSENERETDPEVISAKVGEPILTILLDRTKAFEAFRATCPEKAAEISAEDKEHLRQLCAEGKTIGEKANHARTEISRLRQKLESMRLCDAMRSVDGEVDETGQEYVTIKDEMNRKMEIYQTSAETLKNIKSQIDRIQFVANQNKHKIQRDFENWFVAVRKRTNLDEATNASSTEQLNEYYKIREEILGNLNNS